MRTIDLSKYQAESGIVAAFKNLQGILSYGFSWYQSRKSQEELIPILDSVLGNNFVLLRDINIPKVNHPIPLVLIAPSGLYVINPKNISGYFRAEGKRWEKLGRNDEYELDPNNLIRETWLYTKTIEGYFKQHNFSVKMDRGIMIFVSPETSVESIRPRARVIRADGIINFAREIATEKAIFSDIDLRTALNLLTKPRLPKKTKKEVKEVPEEPKNIPAPKPSKFDENIEKIGQVTDRANFTRREWVIIGILIALVILVLVALITFVIFTL